MPLCFLQNLSETRVEREKTSMATVEKAHIKTSGNYPIKTIYVSGIYDINNIEGKKTTHKYFKKQLCIIKQNECVGITIVQHQGFI